MSCSFRLTQESLDAVIVPRALFGDPDTPIRRASTMSKVNYIIKTLNFSGDAPGPDPDRRMLCSIAAHHLLRLPPVRSNMAVQALSRTTLYSLFESLALSSFMYSEKQPRYSVL